MAAESRMTQGFTTLRTIKEIALRCRVNDRTVRRWISNKELSIHRLGRQIRISEADFAAFLKRHRE